MDILNLHEELNGNVFTFFFVFRQYEYLTFNDNYCLEINPTQFSDPLLVTKTHLSSFLELCIYVYFFFNMFTRRYLSKNTFT